MLHDLKIFIIFFTKLEILNSNQVIIKEKIYFKRFSGHWAKI